MARAASEQRSQNGRRKRDVAVGEHSGLAGEQQGAGAAPLGERAGGRRRPHLAAAPAAETAREAGGAGEGRAAAARVGGAFSPRAPLG